MRTALRAMYRSRALSPVREKLVHLERATETHAQILAARIAALERKVEDLEQIIEAERRSTVVDFRHWEGQTRQNYEPLANEFECYRALVRGLERIGSLRILPVHAFATARSETDRLLALRHDIDADPRTGLRMARFLASRGVPGTFYLQHTAPYYGQFHGGAYYRNPELEQWVRGLIVTGCEIGLHNDALGADLQPGIDGPAALAAEIAWLRALGAVIRGTAAHNSAPAYGAANSEVFVGRRLGPWSDRAVNGHRLPLESLREDVLGLEYEGTFAVADPGADAAEAERFVRDRAGASLRSEAWMRRYLVNNPTCAWDVDLQIWVIGRDEWVIGGRPGGTPRFEWCVGVRRVLDVVASLPAGTRCLMVLHPEYFLR